MPFTKLWIHFVWATKDKLPLLTTDVRTQIINHIKEHAKVAGIHLSVINGSSEHLHALISLTSTQSVAEVSHLLKGESSHWINKEKLIPGRFEWQEEYFAVSISESGIPNLQRYINSQEEHHRKKSFAEEYSDFIRKYHFIE